MIAEHGVCVVHSVECVDIWVYMWLLRPNIMLIILFTVLCCTALHCTVCRWWQGLEVGLPVDDGDGDSLRASEYDEGRDTISSVGTGVAGGHHCHGNDTNTNSGRHHHPTSIESGNSSGSSASASMNSKWNDIIVYRVRVKVVPGHAILQRLKGTNSSFIPGIFLCFYVECRVSYEV